MDELENRYSKKISADNAEMKAATDRLAAVTAQVNQAQAAAAESAEAEASQKEQKDAQSREWIAKFSPFLDPASESYLLIGSDFNSASKEKPLWNRIATKETMLTSFEKKSKIL